MRWVLYAVTVQGNTIRTAH
ncbi:MAG: hypothetical protein IJD83_00495 [Clostridia bacterium]|nr:hypothetical protein [Clostridia bacterium]